MYFMNNKCSQIEYSAPHPLSGSLFETIFLRLGLRRGLVSYINYLARPTMRLSETLCKKRMKARLKLEYYHEPTLLEHESVS